MARLLAEKLKPNYLAPANRGDTALFDRLLDMGMRLGADVFVRQSEALHSRQDRRTDLRRITVPVLLASGTEDALCPPKWHTDWASRIPNAKVSTCSCSKLGTFQSGAGKGRRCSCFGQTKNFCFLAPLRLRASQQVMRVSRKMTLSR